MRSLSNILFESDRLVFTEFSEDDAAFFFDLNNDNEVMKYTGDVAFDSVEHARRFVESYSHYKEYGYGRWTVSLKDTMEPIGWCGLKYHPDEGYIDLGYRYAHRFWGKGYGTEAAKACLQFGKDQYGIDRVVGRTAQDNIGSIRVLEKLGFTFWKYGPCEGIENSVFYELVLR